MCIFDLGKCSTISFCSLYLSAFTESPNMIISIFIRKKKYSKLKRKMNLLGDSVINNHFHPSEKTSQDHSFVSGMKPKTFKILFLMFTQHYASFLLHDFTRDVTSLRSRPHFRQLSSRSLLNPGIS